MPNVNSTEFSYTYSVPVLTGLTTISGALAAWFAFLAHDNSRGLIIQRTIRLGAESETTFYWSVFALFMLGLLFFLSILLTRQYFPRKVSLQAHYLVAPTSRWPFSMYEQVVKYKDIVGFQTLVIARMKTLRILHRGGKIELDAIRFQSKGHFGAFCSELARRARESHSSAQ